ncbi:MAG: hypothetical protein J6O55_01825 [Lachnospiraceae bacterium]|nr:hypothetical protein [Lachnospiraceae bacterium]
MDLEKEVFEEYKRQISENMEYNKKGALAMKEYLEHSPIYWNGQVEKTLHIPKVYGRETLKYFQEIIDLSYRIFRKVINEYREAEDFRELFPFPDKLKELILLQRQYNAVLPIARLDIFYNEENRDFTFCEINTDGAAAMLRDLEGDRAYAMNPAHQEVIRKYRLRSFELFDSWVETFLNLYDKYENKCEHPNIAIVDYLNKATLRDMEEYLRRFQKAGVDCEICDVRTLKYENGKLYSDRGHRIDAIYRRAVTRDVLEYWDESEDFLKAVRDGAVFLAGAFETQIIHNKWLFHILRMDRTKKILSDDENAFVEAHVPGTWEFDPKDISLEEVRENREKYILKPMDSYASKGIYAAGKEYSSEDWAALTEELYKKGYLCQEYCPQYLTDNIDFIWGDGEFHPYMNMPGLYTFNGKLAGFLSRMAEGEHIIMAHENERTVPAYMVEGKI